MRVGQYLGAFGLGLAAGSACIPNTRLITPSPTGAPEHSESYIGKDICDYSPCYTIEDVFSSPKIMMSQTNPSGDTALLRTLRVYYIEDQKRREELISAFSTVTEENINDLMILFNKGGIDYLFDFHVCSAMPSTSGKWYHPDENDPFMYRKTPMTIYKNETVRGKNQPRVVVAPYDDEIIHVQFDRFDGSAGSYNILCPLPPATSSNSRPIPAP